MLIYGDLSRRADPRRLIAEIAEALRRLADSPAGIERHGDLVAVFIAAGELAQGLADAELEARGCDGPSAAQDAAMSALVAIAHAIRRSWTSGFRRTMVPHPGLLEPLAAMPLPADVRIRHPEGYAFYGLYPECYLAAARALPAALPVRVVGIRSIGTGLAGLVAAVAGSADPVTLRPSGHPFRRAIRISDSFLKDFAGDSRACFAIVDEGPGLSGSSFGAVADVLAAAGVAENRMHFFPSHRNDLGPQADPAQRARWRRIARHVVTFDELVIGAPDPRHRIDA